LGADYRCIGVAPAGDAVQVIDLDDLVTCTGCDHAYLRRLTRLVRTFAGAGSHALAVAVDAGCRFVALPPAWGERVYVARFAAAFSTQPLPRLHIGYAPAGAPAAACVFPPLLSDALMLSALLRVHIDVDPSAVRLDCAPSGACTLRNGGAA
jgi:hypothetical protein